MLRINDCLLAVSLLIFLNGCSTIVGSINSGPVEINPTDRTWGQWMDDQSIETVASVNIAKADPALKKSRIKAISFNDTLLLIGQVPNERLKELAGQTAMKIKQVKQVYNELTIGDNIDLLLQSNDALLTAKIKSALISSDDVTADNIKVYTENATVYLMGLATPATAQIVVNIVRNITGVKKVVKVFEYLPDSLLTTK
ncbi:MAG: BON domain-containing protein [Endozoicomonas sp. (ex Botrylloides leachii)]|nr:BON domain-containing protein [Endozoicomonas sp. (ex Botrylloides leachii)]